MHLVVIEFDIKNRREVRRMNQLSIWSEEVEHETSEAISEYKVCNKLEDDIRSGMLIMGTCGGNTTRWL